MLGFLIGLIVALFSVAVVFFVQHRVQVRELKAKISSLESSEAFERNEKDRLNCELIDAKKSLDAERKLLIAKEEQYQSTLKQGRDQFQALAQQVLEDREKKLKEEATNPLNLLVTQLKQEIENLKQNISQSNEKAAATHTDLMGKITTLVDQTNNVSMQANNLAGAIRGNAQVTGEWAEIQLKRVFELAGIEETTGYTYQETFEDDETGRKSKRTDFIVKMPGDRSVIIDSKNTIASAERFHAAASDEEREEAAKDIAASLRNHVDEIKRANYQSSVPNSLEYVLMYIPLEEVYLLAMKSTISISGQRELLRDYARRNNVIFVNSSSVVPVVRLIEMMWNIERSEKNRQAIKSAAEELLRRANDFVTEFNEIGSAFKTVFEKYEGARKKLIDEKGARSISKAASKLVELGVEPINKSGKKYVLDSSIIASSSEDIK